MHGLKNSGGAPELSGADSRTPRDTTAAVQVVSESKMFEDLYDGVSVIFSWRWPTVSGVITAIDVERISRSNQGESWRLAVAYEFSLGDDGPYTGESFWNPHYFSRRRVRAGRRKFHRGEVVTVRYRKEYPSVNRLDPQVW